MNYWISTKSTLDIMKSCEGLTPAIKSHLAVAEGIDPAIIADELGISVAKIRRWQRILGLREMSNSGGNHIDKRGHQKIRVREGKV